MIVRSEASPPRLLTDVDRAQAARVGRSAGAARPSRAVRQHPGSNNCVEGGLGLPVPLLKRWAAGPPRSRMTKHCGTIRCLADVGPERVPVRPVTPINRLPTFMLRAYASPSAIMRKRLEGSGEEHLPNSNRSFSARTKHHVRRGFTNCAGMGNRMLQSGLLGG